MTSKLPSPINHDVPIVEEDGTPTQAFMRWLTDQLGTNAVVPPLEALVDANAIGVAANAADVGTLNARTISTTTPLSGGGDLSADRTITLDNTAVTPATYGDATNVAQITIDAKGRITAASDVAISGGGGGSGGTSFSWPPVVSTAVSGSGNAFKGALLMPIVDMTIESISAFLNTVSGSTYRAGVYRLDGSDAIDEVTGVSADHTGEPTASGAVVNLVMTSSAALTAGSKYAILFGRTDSSASYALPISTASSGPPLTVHYPSIPTEPFPVGTTNPSSICTIADNDPQISDTVTVSPHAFSYGIGIEFTIG